MTPADARRFVVAALIVLIVVSVLAERGAPKPRTFIAAGAVFLILGFMADFVPVVAGPFAVLVAITAVLTRGDLAFGNLRRKIGGK
jgi:hypothetical protein